MISREGQEWPEGTAHEVMPSTFWMTAQEAEDEIKRRERISAAISKARGVSAVNSTPRG